MTKIIQFYKKTNRDKEFYFLFEENNKKYLTNGICMWLIVDSVKQNSGMVLCGIPEELKAISAAECNINHICRNLIENYPYAKNLFEALDEEMKKQQITLSA